jgi:hypothetical protein
MTQEIGATSVLLDDAARRARAKMRLYVLLQSGGWLMLMMLQSLFVLAMPREKIPGDQQILTFAVVMIMSTSGCLITHFTRPLITRWKWKELGWRRLVPRIIGLSMVMGSVWILITYIYPFALRHPPVKMPLLVAVAGVWINSAVLMAGWLCVYFFYHLFDRFNRSEIERLRLMATVKDAELRALKSQVNPHFIFNALNSLRALIDEEPVRARQAVTQLANLLRYSLQSGQLETVPFEDELRIVNDYLALEQVRHEERLRVRLDVAPDTLNLPIPPMLLQTLVENAVKYGISNRADGGEIAIVARRESDSLRLLVSNPGELNTAGNSGGRSAGSTGVGLRNAAERLRLLFGDRATLQLRAGPPQTVVAEAVLPLQPVRG